MSDESVITNIQQARLAALYEVSSQLGSSLDLPEVLNQVMDAIIQLTGAERGFLMLYDEVPANCGCRRRAMSIKKPSKATPCTSAGRWWSGR